VSSAVPFLWKREKIDLVAGFGKKKTGESRLSYPRFNLPSFAMVDHIWHSIDHIFNNFNNYNAFNIEISGGIVSFRGGSIDG
jgi:hypothetical protein